MLGLAEEGAWVDGEVVGYAENGDCELALLDSNMEVVEDGNFEEVDLDDPGLMFQYHGAR